MEQLLALGGEVVTTRGGSFTVTAYDPILGLFIGMGHSPEGDRETLGSEAWITGAKVGKESLEPEEPGELMGIVTGWGETGVVGLCYIYPEETVFTAKAVPGKAVIRCSAAGEDLPIQVETVGPKQFCFTVEEGTVVKGMSGSPIVQNGRLVGCVWGRDAAGHYCGTRIESMLKELLQQERR